MNNAQISKSGFGLIEVLAAAVVLGFLIVGLTQLQKGNREAVLRIRARDAAQLAATDIIDSLRRIGLNSIDVEELKKTLNKKSVFEGAVGKSEINYTINAEISDDNKTHSTVEHSDLSRASGKGGGNTLAYDYAKRVEVTVKWKFKESDQSIQVSGVIR